MNKLVADGRTGEPIAPHTPLGAHSQLRPDVIALLEEEHRIVLDWFERYRTAQEPELRQRVAADICAALRAHMAAEEEIFYPSAAKHMSDVNLVRRALDEHEAAKGLMGEIEHMALGDQRLGHVMNQLEQGIRKHITEEEYVLMPEVRACGMDVYEVGAAVAARGAE